MEKEVEYAEVTPEMLAALNKEVEEIKGHLNQAKGRLAALEAQMENHVKELEAYNVTPETAPERIAELDREIAELYTKAQDILQEVRNATGAQD